MPFRYLAIATDAQTQIDAETATYNNRIADGKWQGMMSDAPRDQAVFRLPTAALSVAVASVAVPDGAAHRIPAPNRNGPAETAEGGGEEATLGRLADFIETNGQLRIRCG